MAESIENFRLPEFSRLAPGERFDALVDTSRRADTQGLLCPLPATRAEVREEATFPSRIRTIRTRLFLLGYLGRDSKSGTLDARLRGAVRAFQTEAAITVDGWVGRETWKSLEELLSFETPHDLARWFSGGHANPALARAAQVRLHVLGLLRSRHPRTGKKVESALERFALLADLLDLAPGRLRPALSPETLAVLFDHDAIAARMTRADDAFAFNRPRDIARGKARRLLRKFIICTAKIELWLHGFDVLLSGRADFEHPRRLPSTPERYPLHHALYEFWRGAGQTDAEARRSAMTITGRFFRRLQELHEEADKVPDRAGIARLYETLARATPGVLRDIRDQIRSVGSRIWDGLKRAWRWFKSLLARGIRKVTAGTKTSPGWRFATRRRRSPRCAWP
ncbi:MAG: peptidoglycan-binding protein [Acidobacteriota bacterium]